MQKNFRVILKICKIWLTFLFCTLTYWKKVEKRTFLWKTLYLNEFLSFASISYAIVLWSNSFLRKKLVWKRVLKKSMIENSRVLWNISKYLEISWNSLRYLKVHRNIYEYFEISWSMLKFNIIFRISSILSAENFQPARNNYHCILIFPRLLLFYALIVCQF